GGAAVWNTGAYDPESNLTYWGTGNPAPDWDGRERLRQSVQQLRGRAGRGYREAQVVLPVHSTRRDGLRCDPGPGARGPELAGAAAEGDAVGQPQRADV